ncbi:MAG: DNA topoisomerase I [Candidatus Pacearchaeota archaeon]|nr:DNA topoisomerase I [Candidatus Pacearchaeota archaeon]
MPKKKLLKKNEIEVIDNKISNETSIEKTEPISDSTVPVATSRKYTLIIAEKPAAAAKLAFSLADGSPIKKNIYGVPYWELDHKGKSYVIASAVGHLYGLKQIETSKTWPMFNIEWQEKEGFSRKYVTAMKILVKNADGYILATDYDIEGELIGYNVLKFIAKTENARRMKFSALTKWDLTNSFDSMMEHINFGQAYAGETRHYLDWFYGINLSRALMQAVQAAGAFKIMSIGRVQGPTLALLVKKEKEIQAFKPTPYWQVFLSVGDGKAVETVVEVKFPENITSQEEADKFLRLNGKKGQAVTETVKNPLRPFPPFDLTALQMESYKFFGFSPAQTLAIAQKLYLHGLISYPRTSSQKLPPTIGYNRILDKLEKAFPKLMKYLDEGRRNRPVEGFKSDPAHPAIFPTGEQGKITGDEKRIYDLIVKRFLACFAKDALIEDRKITVTVGEKQFFASGKKIVEQGWLNIYPYKLHEQNLPVLNGEVIVKEARLEEKMTEPPRRFSAASLVSELEKRNLGTKTTRAMIVDTLYKRGYITGTQIQATELGIATVDSLEKHSPLILDENLTRGFEEKTEKILDEKTEQEMKKDEENIIEEAKNIIIKISEQFKKNEEVIGKELLEATKHVEQQKKESSKLYTCPVCKQGNLIMLRSRKGKRFAGCDKYPDCKTTFPLPQFGMIKVSEKKCEKCGQPQLVLIKKSRLPWYFCINPNCWQVKEEKKPEESKDVKKEEKVKKPEKVKKMKKETVKKTVVKEKKTAKKI